jgi:pyroglutamyl-peptidase
MTFRIPDVKGYQPNGIKIDDCYDFDCPVVSKLPLFELCQQLKSHGFNVMISNDPGRYLCNYIYYSSLQACEKLQQQISTIQSLPVTFHSLFVHVPSFSVISKTEQIEFMKFLMTLIVDKMDNPNDFFTNEMLSNPKQYEETSLTNYDDLNDEIQSDEKT